MLKQKPLQEHIDSRRQTADIYRRSSENRRAWGSFGIAFSAASFFTADKLFDAANVVSDEKLEGLLRFSGFLAGFLGTVALGAGVYGLSTANAETRLADTRDIEATIMQFSPQAMPAQPPTTSNR